MDTVAIANGSLQPQALGWRNGFWCEECQTVVPPHTVAPPLLVEPCSPWTHYWVAGKTPQPV